MDIDGLQIDFTYLLFERVSRAKAEACQLLGVEPKSGDAPGDSTSGAARSPTDRPKPGLAGTRVAVGLCQPGPVDEFTRRRPRQELVEGEIDAITLDQWAGDLITPVATGSTAGSRCTRWIAKLALAAVVLVAYDVDANSAGDKAAAWWLDVLPNARRWRPLWSDVNEMAVDGADLRAWVRAGIGQ